MFFYALSLSGLFINPIGVTGKNINIVENKTKVCSS